MPQLVLFNRSWNIGSDDFVFSGVVDCVLRIAWFVVVLVMYCVYNNDIDDDCSNGIYLHVYFIGLFVFLVITAVLGAAIVHISMQGTIADSGKRRKLPVFLYARLIVAVPEIVWNALGTYWAFVTAHDCHRTIVNIAKGTVLFGWVVLIICVIAGVIIYNLYTGKNKKQMRIGMRSFRRGSRRTFSHTKQWEKRCKCMFICARDDDRSTSVFSTLAELSADYFKGVDLVPTDVIAGLILLSRQQERKRQQLRIYIPDDKEKKGPTEDMVDAPDVICECLPAQRDWMTLNNMSHFLKFAIGSYGWPFYVTLVNPVLGACSLCSQCKCFSCRDDQGSVFKDNCCMCNTAAFKKTTGLRHDDIVYACFKNDIYELPFYVVIDRDSNSVVVAIRGTLSLQDVITDLVIERGNLDITGVLCACAHNGILQSAMYIKQTLEKKAILETAFSQAEGADLVITGHSLGAGAAALLAILLKPTYPKLKCFAFSPPGELVSPAVSKYAEDIVCSVVLGDDIISRQGMLMMDDLKINIIKSIHETRLPKYQIFASGCWRMCCGRAGTLDENIEYGHIENGSTKTKDSNKYEMNRCSLEMSLTECMAHSQQIKSTYQPLVLPGQILHVEPSHDSGDETFTAAWKLPDTFTEIIVSPDMLAHHFPDALLDAIDELREKNTPVQPVSRTKVEDKIDTRITVE
ncbi:diacylglycerol lipase-beta-like isoform X2 [Mercenaria mercenaria]|uniref:diacylglycerol lipase-beta-like isoform X2 n=1 Tax=Mercenaria mercenaria TaxID=6596 RepID=UPI00234EC9BF|nr:diacylglycerol lipase-beta-like isoform X2 [Mercenaria mercenaria]